MALTTRAAVKAQAGISSTDTSRDAQIDSFIIGITVLVKKYLNRDIESATYTEYYSGNNSSYLMTRQYPIISISRVCVDSGAYAGQASGAFSASDDLVAGTDYCILPGQNGLGSSGMIRRIGGVWPGRPSRAQGMVANQPTVQSGNILVVYVAGFAVVPPAIAMAVNSAVLMMASQAEAGGGVQSESYEDAAQTYFSPQLQAQVFGSVKQALGSYKSIPV